MKNKKINFNMICIWLLAAFYIIMPQYFSFEISASFPSFTASRIIIIFCFCVVFFQLYEKKAFTLPNLKEYKVLFYYAAIIIFVNIIHMRTGFSYSVKAILAVILENLLLVFLMYFLVDTREKIDLFVRILVWTSVVVAVIAFIEFFTGINLFYFLTTTDRTVYQAAYIRLGMTRAEASFGHPVYYGVYCTCILPFSMYLYESLKQKRYLLITALNLAAIVASGTRGSMLIAGLLLVIMFFFKSKEAKKMYYVPILIGIITCLAMIILIPAVRNYIFELVKTILNALGLGLEITQDFGGNPEGLSSRTVQLSGIYWTIVNNAFIFGFGSVPGLRGLVSYLGTYGWMNYGAIDVGYVGWFLEYGLVGALANTWFYFTFTKNMFKKSDEKDLNSFYNPLKWFFIGYLLNLLNSTGYEKVLWIVIGLVICYERVVREENKKTLTPEKAFVQKFQDEHLKENEMDRPMLSIYVPVFNHSRYIVEALDSILMQKTDYTIEVIVGEDASTDDTRAILKDYEKQHPGRLQILYRETNLHKTSCPNGLDLRLRCRGKYIIALEGDDFWLDENKIDKQIRFLEEHPDYIAVAHNCIVVDENSKKKDETYPECRDEEYTLKHYASDILPGQLATVMYRNIYMDPVADYSLSVKGLTPGDRLLYFILASNGKIHCIQEPMSAYRHVKHQGSSYSATFQYKFEKSERWFREQMEYAYSIERFWPELYAELLYTKNISYALQNKFITWREAVKCLGKLKNKFPVSLLFVKQLVYRKILHKTIYV